MNKLPQVYCVYGLRVLADAPIPGLLPANGAEYVDVRVWLDGTPPWWDGRPAEGDAVWYRSPYEKGLIIWKLVEAGWYRLVYYDGNEFWVNPSEGEVWCRPSVTAQNLGPYLVGPVLGFVLRLREVCCLHASAIRVGQKVIAFSGPPHAGKSTTAAAFAKLGYSVVSDDIVALAERGRAFLARPGYPRLCLWPEAATSLCGPSTLLPRMAATGDKLYLDLAAAGQAFETKPLPLSAIYLLDERVDDADYPRVSDLSTRAALIKLAANTYMNYLLDAALRSKEFQFLSRLVSTIPVRRVIPHTDPAHLSRLCETILRDHAGLLAEPGVIPENA